MKINSFQFISYNLLPKLGDYTALQFNYLVEFEEIKNKDKTIPSNYLTIKIADTLNMLWELDYSQFKLSDVLFEYAKNYILYQIRNNKLEKKETIEINELHRNILLSYVREKMKGFSTESIQL
ncbi:MAG: hypothetical protein WCE54_13545 [Ignavibacteriaceae bacterium]